MAAVCGIAVSALSSRLAVDNLARIGGHFGVSPLIMGLTVLAIGTDLPEIANSIIASLAGEGDLNAGDSIGSSITQLTLVFAVLGFASAALPIERRTVVILGIGVAGALGFIALLGSDDDLSRIDGAMLLSAWALGTVLIWRSGAFPEHKPMDPGAAKQPDVWRHLIPLALGLVGLTAGTWVAIEGFLRIAEALGAPTFVLSFFALSIGTSLPELVVDLTALRRGQARLAIGDIFGSSFVDATLSIGIGPFIAPTAVTGRFVVISGVGAAVAALVVTALLAWRGRLDRTVSVGLIACYAALYALLLA